MQQRLVSEERDLAMARKTCEEEALSLSEVDALVPTISQRSGLAQAAQVESVIATAGAQPNHSLGAALLARGALDSQVEAASRTAQMLQERARGLRTQVQPYSFAHLTSSLHPLLLV